MSNHFTGLSLGPPLGDQRLDLCDLYAFQSPADPTRTVLILNANPNADALHPAAIYRLAIDNDGDLRNDIAFSFVFSEPQDGRQTVDVYLATDEDAESAEAGGGEDILLGGGVVRRHANIATSAAFTFCAGARSDAFFFDFDGIKNLFDTSGGRNFTAPHLGGSRRGRRGLEPRRTCARSRSRCRRPRWAPTRTSGSGAGAACGER